MTKKPAKRTGEIGSTLVTPSPTGTTAVIIHAELPSIKENLETFFATLFVATFNQAKPLGPDVTISNLVQNDTSDLDFTITSSVADYLELAELNPQSEPFGRSAIKTGELNVYDYAKWIFLKIIRRKDIKYGPIITRRAFLLLYATHWQFLIADPVIECLRSHVQGSGCGFAGVFILKTNGSDLNVIETVHPYFGPKFPKPSAYSRVKYFNLEPGQSLSIGPAQQIASVPPRVPIGMPADFGKKR